MDIILIVTQLNEEPELFETGEALQIHCVLHCFQPHLEIQNVLNNPLDVLKRLPKGNLLLHECVY